MRRFRRRYFVLTNESLSYWAKQSDYQAMLAPSMVFWLNDLILVLRPSESTPTLEAVSTDASALLRGDCDKDDVFGEQGVLAWRDAVRAAQTQFAQQQKQVSQHSVLLEAAPTAAKKAVSNEIELPRHLCTSANDGDSSDAGDRLDEIDDTSLQFFQQSLTQVLDGNMDEIEAASFDLTRDSLDFVVTTRRRAATTTASVDAELKAARPRTMRELLELALREDDARLRAALMLFHTRILRQDAKTLLKQRGLRCGTIPYTLSPYALTP
ncbi:MAG: hypothetical protein MHM6MM_007689, partial [Cercozoa sp. M6MM]